jgi:hypothetical protein
VARVSAPHRIHWCPGGGGPGFRAVPVRASPLRAGPDSAWTLRGTVCELPGRRDRAVSPQRTRPGYDPWRDAEGTPIPNGCHVEQVGVSKERGALPSRLHQRGQVVGRGTNRLYVRFESDDQLITLRPHLLRVLTVEAELALLAPRTLWSGSVPSCCPRPRPGPRGRAPLARPVPPPGQQQTP